MAHMISISGQNAQNQILKSITPQETGEMDVLRISLVPAAVPPPRLQQKVSVIIENH